MSSSPRPPHLPLPLTLRLRRRLDAARDGDVGGLDVLAAAEPTDPRDALTALLEVHALHLAPLEDLDGRERFQHHPAVAALKGRLEHRLVAALDDAATRIPVPVDGFDAVPEVRRLANANLVPAVYDWAADVAPLDALVEFLAIEGGPDGGFDPMVAPAQIGLGDTPTTAFPLRNADALPLPALRRRACDGLLATNRALQPEMLGALGTLELQVGPRARRVITGLTRVDAPQDALAGYAEHAEADPYLGAEWLDHTLAPLVAKRPQWGPRFVRGARWRCLVDDALFADLLERFRPARVA